MTLSFNSIVFGGSGQLGSAICKTLKRDIKKLEAKEEGSQVSATYFREDIDNRITDLNKAGIATLHCDIRQKHSITSMLMALEMDIGALTSMVYAIGSFNNLSYASDDGVKFYTLEELSAEQIQDSISLHTQGVISACQATLAMFRQAGGGNIVLLGTLNGLKLVPSPVHLAASKSALLGITQSLAKELGNDNIRINLVVPGMVNSSNLDKLPQHQKDIYLKHSAQKRFAEIQEVAEVVSWFALENTYVTGQAIILDGGL